MAIEKLSSMAKRFGVLFRVMQRILIGVMIAMVLVLAVLSIVNALRPGIVIGTALNELDIGAVTLILEPLQVPDNGSILAYAWVSVGIGILWGAALCVGLHLLRKMLRLDCHFLMCIWIFLNRTIKVLEKFVLRVIRL